MDKLAPTLYDIIGYIIPGLLMCYSSILFYSLFFDPNFVVSQVWFSNSLVIFLLAYLVGQIVQAVAKFFIKISVENVWNMMPIDVNFKKRIFEW